MRCHRPVLGYRGFVDVSVLKLPLESKTLGTAQVLMRAVTQQSTCRSTLELMSPSISARKKGYRVFRHMCNSFSTRTRGPGLAFSPSPRCPISPPTQHHHPAFSCCCPGLTPPHGNTLYPSAGTTRRGHTANSAGDLECLAPPVHRLQVSWDTLSPLLPLTKNYILRSALIQSRYNQFSFTSTLCSKLPMHLHKKPMETT